MKKKKIPVKKIIALMLFSLHPLVFVYLLRMITDHPIYVAIAMFASLLFMVVTHETGHLLFGLLTGYKFISFRIFCFMLLRENGMWKFKVKRVPGTSGQCLMAPPRKKGYRYPYALYNLGGILLCGILSSIPIVISVFHMDHSILGLPLFVFGAVSFLMNLLNAIPTNGKGMLNDATNLRMANRSAAGKEALWNQLEYIHLLSENVRTADMPAEIFFYPQKQDLDNTLVQWQVILNVERCEDMGLYEKAKEAAEDILQNAPFLPTFFEDILKTELIFLDTILGSTGDHTEKALQALEKHKVIQKTPNFARALYAYRKLVQKDDEAASEAHDAFEKKLKKEPYPATQNFERRQMAYIAACERGIS